MISPDLILFALIIFIIGLCFGSFGNVLIDRLPKGLGVVKPPSHCFKCKKPIKFYDNIPLISYLILNGKCRACKIPFTSRHFFVELLSGLIFLALFLKLGFTWFFLECLIFSWGMLVASFIDLDHRILPDVFTLPGIVMGIAGSLLNPERIFLDALFGVFIGGGLLWLIAYLYAVIKKEEGMGGGDIKLLAWIGAVLGWKSIIFTILVSSILGSIVGLMVAARQKSGLKTAIPFGPFLSLAAFIYIFIGHEVVQSYLKFFFPFME